MVNYKEKWELLLEDKRFREKSLTISSDARNPFENDYGRLISSSPIRRLQDKTQVFPLEQSDYIRTRLTHSLEVSYIASSIGQSVEYWLIGRGEIKKDKKGYLSSLLRVAGLVHDLGNPPFGHFGEDAIRNFFKDYFQQREDSCSLSTEEKNDFIHFDGNVQTFRILSKLYYFGDEFGYNLTYSSLASIIKYPSNSTDGNKGDKYSEIAKKKFGYFITEKDKYKKINTYLQLNNRRSPVVYLLEAADDIAYSAADIEDGLKLGIIDISKVREVFKQNLKENKDSVLDEIKKLAKKYKENPPLLIQKFRIFAQQIMIEKVIETFKEKYEDIMKGKLEKELIEVSSAADIRKSYKELQKIIFNDKNILKKEIAGWETIRGLLEIFVKASESPNFKENGKNYESKLYKLISFDHRHVFTNIEKYKKEEYKKLQMIVDYISGMTDTYALNLFQNLKGIKL